MLMPEFQSRSRQNCCIKPLSNNQYIRYYNLRQFKVLQYNSVKLKLEIFPGFAITGKIIFR